MMLILAPPFSFSSSDSSNSPIFAFLFLGCFFSGWPGSKGTGVPGTLPMTMGWDWMTGAQWQGCQAKIETQGAWNGASSFSWAQAWARLPKDQLLMAECWLGAQGPGQHWLFAEGAQGPWHHRLVAGGAQGTAQHLPHWPQAQVSQCSGGPKDKDLKPKDKT